MDSFSISVDLSSFFSDFRAKSLVFVNTGLMKTVTHVETHIKTLFGINSKTYVLSQNNFVPGGEDSRILQKLTTIRLVGLAAESSSTKRDRAVEHENETEEHENFELISKRKRKLEKVANTHTDDTSQSDTIRSSKRKKKQDDDDLNGDQPSTSNGISVGCSSSLKHPSACGVGKVRKDKDHHLTNKDSSFIDSSSSNRKDKMKTPNSSLSDGENLFELLTRETQSMKGQKRDVQSTTPIVATENSRDGSETSKDTSNLSANIDHESGKCTKRKRIRKRKKAIKEETHDETEIVNAVKPTTPLHLRVPQANSRHVFFQEEEGEDSQTPENMLEEETMTAEDPIESTVTEPDDKTGESREDKIHNGDTNGDVHSSSTQASVSKDSVQHTGTDDPPSASRSIGSSITKQKHDNGRVRQGLGKLMSLIRSEDPPVFERQKTPRNDQAATPRNAPITPVLKTLPEQNMKISFQILKMSASYCPELSNTIVAVVMEVDAATQNLSLKILSGGEECQQPKGKFDLDPEGAEEETRVDDINLNWSELIEPRVCQ